MKKKILEWVYKNNRNFFELMLIKDFVGFIPKEVNEPTLKVFKEFGEQFEKWTLWQSWFINRRAINDPTKISFYHGMMVYLKVLNTMARVNKKNYQPIKTNKEAEVVVPWIENAIKDLDYFKNNVNNKNYKADKTA